MSRAWPDAVSSRGLRTLLLGHGPVNAFPVLALLDLIRMPLLLYGMALLRIEVVVHGTDTEPRGDDHERHGKDGGYDLFHVSSLRHRIRIVNTL
jgi:hypothetical protein